MILRESRLNHEIRKYKSVVESIVEYNRDKGYNLYNISLKIKEHEYLADFLVLGDIKDNLNQFSSTSITFNIEYI